MKIETLKAVVHPWLCDAMGHMNVRFYTGFFDDASSYFVGQIGGGVNDLASNNLGWADVRHVMEFKNEVRSGGLVKVTTNVTKIGRSSLTFRHEMTDTQGNVHATMEIVTVMFDLMARQSAPLPDAIKEHATTLLEG